MTGSHWEEGTGVGDHARGPGHEGREEDKFCSISSYEANASHQEARGWAHNESRGLQEFGRDTCDGWIAPGKGKNVKRLVWEERPSK